VNLDAIARTAWRMLVTRRRLLEWNPPPRRRAARRARSRSCRDVDRAGHRRGAALLALAAPRRARCAAAPILLLWFASPAIAWWVSRPMRAREARLAPSSAVPAQARAPHLGVLRVLRGPEDHWLPPDNFQEHPVATVAHRTSPTNMGSRCSRTSRPTTSATSRGRAARRTPNALATMGAGAPRGHFYNWYDTRTLQPLLPLYVSAVDSGNLAGHLMTLRPGLARARRRAIVDRAGSRAGDTLATLAKRRRRGPARVARCRATGPLATRARHLARARMASTHLQRRAEVAASGATPARRARFWPTRSAPCAALREELALLAPRGDRPSRRCASSRARTGAASGASPRALADRAPRAQCGELARMDYGFLYDGRATSSPSATTSRRRARSGFYDLLASEARFASFVAIAQGELPQESWFALGRLLTAAGGRSVLLSWSGSMFEYLMPMLVMPTYDDTLLDQTCRARSSARSPTASSAACRGASPSAATTRSMRA
jgi:hypothetical protein